MKKLLWLLLALASSRAACAQTYFNQHYSAAPGTGQTTSFTSVLPIDSGYAVVGQSYDYPMIGAGSFTFWFLTSTGQPIQPHYYGKPGHFYFSNFSNSLLKVPGGYASSGTVFTPNQENYPMLWRFDAQGDTLWTHTYGPTPHRIAYNGCRTPDGGYALTGTARITGAPNYNGDLWLLRTDSLGQRLWERTYAFNYADDGTSIVPTPDGGLLIGGKVRYPGAIFDTYDALVLKVDSLGTEQWRRTLGTAGTIEAEAVVAVLGDGTYLAATSITDTIINSYEQARPALYWLDPATGQTLRQGAYGVARNGTGPYALHALADGGIVVAGQSGNPANATPVGNGFQQGFMLKVCTDGGLVWYRTYQQFTGGQSQHFLRDVRPTADGGFVGCGFLFSRPPDPQTNDAWAFKLDSAGYLQAGGAPPTVQCTPVGLGEPPAATEALDVSAWPNPSASGLFTVRASPPAPLLKERGAYTVTDALGRMVATGPFSEAETTVDLRAQAPGVYALQLTWPDGRAVTRRLVRW